MGRETISVLLSALRILAAINSTVLKIGRTVAWIALFLMVVVILLQVVFRYALDNALAWPDEAARFLMLWMTGLIAPSAYRVGGFVAIETLIDALPGRGARILNLLLLCMGGVVLFYGIQFGWKHTFGFGGNFESSSLRIPLDLVGGEAVKVKLRYMYGSLLTGMFLMFVVTIELVLREIAGILDPDVDLPPVRDEALLVSTD